MMVALVAGAIAITSIYYVSAASSRHFQEQQRVAQTQMNLRMAIEQLRRDVALAGYLGTPNSGREQRCIEPLAPITAVSLENGAATGVLPNAAGNLVEADTLRLTGNFVTADSYLAVGLNAGGNQLTLQRTWQSFRRTFGAPGAGGYSEAAFVDVFRTGRWLHITTQQGNHFFVQITGQNGAQASVTFTPSLPIGGHCVGGLADGAQVAPLTRIEYTVMDAQSDPTLASLRRSTAVEGGVHPVLVRREIALDSLAPVANTERIVAEYVANFDVDFIMDDQTGTGGAPILTRYDDADAQAELLPTANPHHARVALVNLALRGPREDPRFLAGGYDIRTDAIGMARVRGLAAEVLIPNVANRMMRP